MDITTLDQYVIEFQTTGESANLVDQYKNFLNKYAKMLWTDTIDYRNYDVRSFISCFIPDSHKTLRNNLLRPKYHTIETKKVADDILRYLRFKLRHHSYEDLEHELIVPFLQVAKRYKQMGIGFHKYLYKTYRFDLKRHLDKNVKLDAIDQPLMISIDIWVTQDTVQEELEEIQLDEIFEFMDPDWIYGKEAGEPFCDLESHERYILAKYYHEGKTDKEIARMLPYHPKSIHRIRMRLKEKFIDLYRKGELKWIRM